MPKETRHGTYAMYVGGCRCQPCRLARNQYMRRYRDRSNPDPLKHFAARIVEGFPQLQPDDQQAIRAILASAEIGGEHDVA